MSFTIKRGDTLPVLAAVLTDGNDDPIDVSGADAVTFRMRREDGAQGTRMVDKAVDFTTDGSDGAVEVTFTEDETTVDGTPENQPVNCIGEFVIDWGGGDIQTVPADDYVRVKLIPII
jgi:hypothetical protein